MSFTTVDMCAITGLTYRQADYWFRKGYLRAKGWTPQGNLAVGTGTERRLLDDDELDVACIMARFVEAGLTVPVAEKAARFVVETSTAIAQIGPGIDVMVRTP